MTLFSGKRPRVVGLCEISASPVSWWHKLMDIFPYWQGAKPRFKLHFKALADINSHNYVYAIEVPNRDKSYPSDIHEIRISVLEKGAERSYPTREIPLVYTGDSFLVVAEVIGEEELKYQTVYMFHTTSRSWLGLTVFAVLVAGILAGVVSWLLN